MANEKNLGLASPPASIPARRFHEDMDTVLMLASVFNYDAKKTAEQAKLKSQLEWGMDMEWLDEVERQWQISTQQRAALKAMFCERHRDTWGEFAYTGD